MDLVLPDKVKETILAMQKAGYECYAVGGPVRDLLLKKNPNDWDFTTNATPEEIQNVFPNSFYDNNFGTVGIKINDDEAETKEVFHITPYRKEGKYSDTRHPDSVVWARTIEEDLSRRDFTVNAIALQLSLSQKGNQSVNFTDPFNGQEDLKNKVIRAVGKPEDRFQEDALRLMRAIRFATQLGFVIDELTWQAIKNNAGLITKVSGERIRDELIKIMSSEYPADGVRILYASGLLQYILPELVAGVGVSQKGTHHVDDVFDHCLNCLKFCPSYNWVVRFATLIHDIGKPVTYKERNGKATFYTHETVGARIARDIAFRFHFSKEDREKIYMLVRWHMFSVSEFLTDAAIRRFIKRVGAENTTDMLDLRTSDRLGSGVKSSSWRHEEFKARIVEVQKHIPSVKDLKVNGKDVMKVLGIPPGPKVGEILEKLFEEITQDPTKNDRQILLERVDKLGRS